MKLALGAGARDAEQAVPIQEQLPVLGASGRPLLLLDPAAYVRPLSDLELQGTLEALTKAFANREVSLTEYLIAMFFMLFAPRPIQLAAM